MRTLLARWGDRAHGIGDDAAVLELAPGARLVVSTDTSAEDVHFRRAWFSPEEIGWRAATSALSDLAAMAARPVGLLLAIVVPAAWRDALDALGDGVGAAAAAVGCPIVGGDLTSGRDLVVTVTVLGAATAPVLRGGAQPGDQVYVTGTLGGPQRALAALLAGREPAPRDRARFARPQARVTEALWLADHGARALIDISDGLLAEAAHLAAAGGVTIEIDPAAVPRMPEATPDVALTSGEEYELLCALPARTDDATVIGEFGARFGLSLTRVGTVQDRAKSAPGVSLVGGARVDLLPGHDHFTR